MDDKLATDHHQLEAIPKLAANDLADAQRVEIAAHEMSTWQTIKSHKRIIAVSIALTIAPLMDGFDTIAMNLCLTMPAFDRVFGVHVGSTYVIEATWQSAWAAMYQIGICFGALSSAQVSDRLGRRAAMAAGCIISAAGVAVLFAADTKAMFLIGKIINGYSIGILIATCQVYNSEIVPLKLRGPILALFTFSQVLGQLISVSIVHGRVGIQTPMAYRLPFALEWIWPGLLAIIVLLIPESPWHLLRAGGEAKAAAALKRLHGSDYDTAPEIALMQKVTEEEQLSRASSGKAGFVDCFKGSNRRRTLIACFIVVVQQAAGVVFYSNSSYFLLQAGMSADKSIMATEIGIALALPANAISWFTMSRFGRRTLLIFSLSTVTCIMLAVGIAGSVPRTTASLWTLGGLLIVSPFFYNLGVGSVYPVLAAEVPSTELRAQTSSIAFFAFAFGSFSFNLFFPYMYNTTAGNLGGKCGYFFAGLSIICIFVVYFFVPETFGRTYAELDEIFEEGISARKSSAYVCKGVITHTAAAAEKGNVTLAEETV